MAGRIDPPSSAGRLDTAAIERQARMGEVWVIGGPPVACIFLTPEDDALYLGKLAVRPGCRGRGHGLRLLQLAACRARALGLTRLRLKVRIELVENHAFFRRAGFVQVGEATHPGHDRTTTLIFARELVA